MSAATASRPRPLRDPLRLLLSAEPWTAGAYLASYLLVGTGLFVVAVTVLVTTAFLSILWIGIPLLAAAAVLVRGCAEVERGRLRMIAPEPVPRAYLEVTSPGLIAQVKTRWRDPATRHDVAYLVGLYVPLLVLDTVVLSLWLGFLGGITVPLWYWSIPQTFDNGQTAHGLSFGYFPNGPHGHGAIGLWVGDLPAALLAAALCLGLLMLCNYLVVITARVHGRIARALLGPASDPLAAAKQMLASPGPLA
jgi:hypothetical protein